MISLRQIEANRHTALKSTGPKTEIGKQSRRNALRHGFTAETVLEPLEKPDEYRIFEDAIVSEYLPQTPVEQECVHRLASLFWRLRRATSIDTGLLQMQSEILRAFRSSRQPRASAGDGEGTRSFAGISPESAQDGAAPVVQPDRAQASRDIALSFLRLANLDSDIVHRLSRAVLWRQLAQTLFTLQALKRW